MKNQIAPKPPGRPPAAMIQGMKATAARTGISLSDLKQWNLDGCPGIRSGRCYLREIQRWLEGREDREERTREILLLAFVASKMEGRI